MNLQIHMKTDTGWRKRWVCGETNLCFHLRLQLKKNTSIWNPPDLHLVLFPETHSSSCRTELHQTKTMLKHVCQTETHKTWKTKIQETEKIEIQGEYIHM